MPVLAIVFNCVGVDARNRKTGFFFCYCKPAISIFITMMMMINTTFQLSSWVRCICLPMFWVFAHPPGCRGVYGGSDSSVHIWETPAHSASALAASGKPSPRFPHSLPGSPGLYPSQTQKESLYAGKNPIQEHVQEQSCSVQIAAPKACTVRLSDLPVAPPEPGVPASRQRAAERTPPGCSQGQECRSPH